MPITPYKKQERLGQDGITWLDITDFRPGIVQTLHATERTPAPLGSATMWVDNAPGSPNVILGWTTILCWADPVTGALRPWYQSLGNIPLSVPTSFPPASATYQGQPSAQPMVVGFNGWRVIHSSYGFVDQLLMAIEWANPAQRGFQLWALSMQTPQVTNVDAVLIDSYSTNTGSALIGRCDIETTRLDLSAQGGVLPFDQFRPVIAYRWANPDNASARSFLGYWPQPPTGTPGYILQNDDRLRGYLKAYQGLLVLAVPHSYPFSSTSPYSYGATDTFAFTYPPFSTQVDWAYNVFVPEEPIDITVMGQLDVNQFIAIGSRSGAFLASGPFSNPTIRYLPGVVPTGPMAVVPKMTPIGFVYATANSGWQVFTGSSSQRLTTAIWDQAPNYFTLGQPSAIPTYFGLQPYNVVVGRGRIEFVDHFIILPGGLFYDIETKALWNAAYSPVFRFFAGGQAFPIWFWSSATSGILYGAGPSPYMNSGQQGAPNNVFAWNVGGWHSVYQWISNPIPISGRDRLSRGLVMEVVASGNGTVQGFLLDRRNNVSFLTNSVSVNNEYPVAIRMEFVTNTANAQPGSLETDLVSVGVLVNGTGGSYAPTVHRISLGFITKAGLQLS
jgi:hypothetical protein